MTEDERHAVLDECFEYNNHLRANGHLVAEVPLQPPETALTLHWKDGKVATSDGPYAETKEQVGGRASSDDGERIPRDEGGHECHGCGLVSGSAQRCPETDSSHQLVAY